MFQTPAQSPVQPSTQVPAQASPVSELTRVFQVPVEQEQLSPPPPEPTKSGPGEFTRMFQTPAQASAQPPAQPSVPASLQPLNRQDPDEFTRMFQTPAATPPANNLQDRPFITPERPITCA